MKIPKISTLTTRVQNYIKRAENRFCPAFRFPLSEKPDTFCRQGYSDYFEWLPNKPPEVQKLLENISPESYKKLSPKELDIVCSQIPRFTAENAECVVNISNMLKNTFDNKYGEGNYVFVSIGRSLSTVSQCLELLGVEARRLPFSGCCRLYNKGISERIVKQQQFHKYKDFLDRQLADRHGKKYIFCDYATTGSTLKTFKELLNHPKVQLGSKEDVYFDINKILYKIGRKHHSLLDELIYFANRLFHQDLDSYSDIGYLNYKKLRLVANALKPDNPVNANDFRFCLIDILSLNKNKVI